MTALWYLAVIMGGVALAHLAATLANNVAPRVEK